MDRSKEGGNATRRVSATGVGLLLQIYIPCSLILDLKLDFLK